MSDIRDPYEAERLDVVAPEEYHTAATSCSARLWPPAWLLGSGWC